MNAGLHTKADLGCRREKKSMKITDSQMRHLALSGTDTLPMWNYTIALS